MARILRPGNEVKGYKIVDVLGRGAMAISYEARSRSGDRVFFKQYKSPSPTVPWYDGYVKYQEQFKERIESTNAHRYCYKFIDFFEEKVGSRCYFQVFEFVEKGSDLGKILAMIRSDPSSVSWEQRLILARVMMAGISALHEASIVHCDLKPPNIQLIRDESIKAGYVLKLIDMDFSILADRRAPWDGQQGYVGSPGYFSPEHLISPPPQPASDVFTCGLMLYELLGDGHPYAAEEPDDYQKAVLKYRASKPRLAESMPPPADEEDVISTLYQCLTPSPADRPSAKEVLTSLQSSPTSSGVPHVPSARVPTSPPPKKDPPPLPDAEPSLGPGQLHLVNASGKELKVAIRTEIGKYLLRQLGDDSQFFDTLQFTLEPGDDGRWQVVPNANATNETLLNGHAITTRAPLSEGDVLAVGREAKGVSKLPLTVRLSR